MTDPDLLPSANPLLLEAIVESAPTALLVVDVRGRLRFANLAALQLFGYTRDELLGQPVELLLPERARAAHPRQRNELFSHPRARQMGIGRNLLGRRSDGSEIPIEVGLTPLDSADGPMVLAVVLDISGRRQLERRFELAVEAAPIAMLMVDAAGCITNSNRECDQLFGYGSGELCGHPIERLLPARFHVHPRRRAAFFRVAVPRRLGHRQPLFGLRRDGSELPVEVGLSMVPGTIDSPLYLAVLVDLTEHQRLAEIARRANEALEERVRERTEQLEQADLQREALLADLQRQRTLLEILSREDGLTGLANRRDFDQRLETELHRAQRSQTPLALAMFDLDHFKQVNDGFGHLVGDAVLRQVADLIRLHCRSTDLVARFGGEEFVLALPDTSQAAACAMCERIRLTIEAHDWGSICAGLAVTASAGVAELKQVEDAATLLGRADGHLYEAKRDGRNRVYPSIA